MTYRSGFALLLVFALSPATFAGSRKPAQAPAQSQAQMPAEDELPFWVRIAGDDRYIHRLSLAGAEQVPSAFFEGDWEAEHRYRSAAVPTIRLGTPANDSSQSKPLPRKRETISFRKAGAGTWVSSKIGTFVEYRDRPVSFVGPFASFVFDAGYGNRGTVVCMAQPKNQLVCWDKTVPRGAQERGEPFLMTAGMTSFRKVSADAR
jgi:hypothetical protein